MQIHDINTQIHKYKYKNTVWAKFADTPNICYIFEKVMVRGPQKQSSQMSYVQVQKYKYTNTALVKIAGRPSICYIFEKVMVRGPQQQCSPVSDVQMQLRSKLRIGPTCDNFWKCNGKRTSNKISECLKCKYSNTNIQNHTNTQKIGVMKDNFVLDYIFHFSEYTRVPHPQRMRMQIWLDRRKNMPCLCKTANNEIDWVETRLDADNARQFGDENLTNVTSPPPPVFEFEFLRRYLVSLIQ